MGRVPGRKQAGCTLGGSEAAFAARDPQGPGPAGINAVTYKEALGKLLNF